MDDSLKFDNEKDAGSAPKDLAATSQKISGAIEAQASQSVSSGEPSPGGSTGGDDFVGDLLMAKVGGGNFSGEVMAGGAALLGDMGGKNDSFFPGEQRSGGGKRTKNKDNKSSLFIGQGSQQHKKPLNGLGMVMSYSEAKSYSKFMKKKGSLLTSSGGRGSGKDMTLFEKANVTSMSTTSGSKGAKIDPQSAIRMGLVSKELAGAFDNVQKAKNGPMSKSRMEKGLLQGNSKAQDFANEHRSYAESALKDSPSALKTIQKSKPVAVSA